EALSKTPNGSESCPISQLPNELLLRIFSYLKQRKVSPQTVYPIVDADLLRASLVCKAWHNPAICVFYEVVQLRTVHSIQLFHRTLQKYPHIRKMVRVLVFPARIGVRCPDALLDTFAEIVNLVENLDSLDVTCPVRKSGLEGELRHILPIAEGRHPDLKRLTIYANSKVPAEFPASLATYSRLIKLSLVGVFLSKPILADTMPILPELLNFSSTAGNAASQMDSWLLACPKLGCLTLGKGEAPPLSLLTKGNIVLLIFTQRTFDPSVATWLPECTSVHCVVISWAIFSNIDHKMFPPSLHLIQITVCPRDRMSLETFKARLGENVALRGLQFWVIGNNKWPVENEEALKDACKTSGVLMAPPLLSASFPKTSE
ncbi:hypothetical protein FRC17_008017, partial [Serendipita sp. 399]